MQPLTSALGGYSADALETQLRSGGGVFGCRFEVMDPTLAFLFDLDASIETASVEMNVDRDVKGSLGLTMQPVAAVNPGPFQYRLKAWWQLQMPDGGLAEWPMGVYVWNVPKRQLSSVGIEQWTLTLGDQLQILQMSGPGPGGFKVAAGQLITDAIALAIVAAGFSDVSGIAPSTATAQADLVWSIRSKKSKGDASTSWFDILSTLHTKIGYYTPWFDLSGRYRATPQPDLQLASVDMTYQTESTGLMMMPLDTGTELDRLANRVIARSKNPKANGLYATATTDLNDLYPGHPLSQSVIGFYIDVILEDQVSTTTAGLQVNSDAEMNRRLTAYQTVTMPTLAWPVHEAFDVIGVQWTNDLELGSEQKYHERRWTLDLRAATMTHELRRISVA